MNRHPKSPSDGPIQAAQYVRMSAEHQQYSIDNQSEAISLYARTHRMEVVKTYSDAGKSGLTIEHRPCLRQMIEDVERGSTGYSAMLVYDVSRWGRFQDADERAYYEYRCRRANIAVHYCAEPFSNDGSLAAAFAQNHQTYDGRRIQPRAVCQGVRSPVEVDGTGLSAGWNCGIWP
jgi:DNA invertase Pin-like site-specific DNA recombinase